MSGTASRITLSFDNGPEPDVTPAVLDVLRRRGLHATFFVLGHKLADPACHAIASRAHAEGHWIGNHTWSHARPLGECADEPGHAIELEVWDMPMAQVGSFLALIPAPLGLGNLELADGRWVHGFVCEGHALAQARDVSPFGGWRNYVASLTTASVPAP